MAKNSAAFLEKAENFVGGLHSKIPVKLPGTHYGKAIAARNDILILYEKQIRYIKELTD